MILNNMFVVVIHYSTIVSIFLVGIFLKLTNYCSVFYFNYFQFYLFAFYFFKLCFSFFS